MIYYDRPRGTDIAALLSKSARLNPAQNDRRDPFVALTGKRLVRGRINGWKVDLVTGAVFGASGAPAGNVQQANEDCKYCSHNDCCKHGPCSCAAPSAGLSYPHVNPKAKGYKGKLKVLTPSVMQWAKDGSEGCCHYPSCPLGDERPKPSAGKACNIKCDGHHCVHWEKCDPPGVVKQAGVDCIHSDKCVATCTKQKLCGGPDCVHYQACPTMRVYRQTVSKHKRSAPDVIKQVANCTLQAVEASGLDWTESLTVQQSRVILTGAANAVTNKIGGVWASTYDIDDDSEVYFGHATAVNGKWVFPYHFIVAANTQGKDALRIVSLQGDFKYRAAEISGDEDIDIAGVVIAVPGVQSLKTDLAKVGDVGVVLVCFNRDTGAAQLTPVFVRVVQVDSTRVAYAFLDPHAATEAGDCGAPLVRADGKVLSIHHSLQNSGVKGFGAPVNTEFLNAHISLN